MERWGRAAVFKLLEVGPPFQLIGLGPRAARAKRAASVRPPTVLQRTPERPLPALFDIRIEERIGPMSRADGAGVRVIVFLARYLANVYLIPYLRYIK